MKRISISEEEFQAVIEEIALDMKLSSGSGTDLFLLLATKTLGRMIECKLFDGRFDVVSEDANMGEEERKTEIQKMVEESLREALKDLEM